MGKLTLRVDHDPDVESPSDSDGWKLYSFSTRHGNFKHPEALGLGARNVVGDLTFTSPGLRRKVDRGLAFVLSCYQHGNIVWSLKGEGPQCRWDTAQVGGILIWEGRSKDLGPKKVDDRRADAKRFLETYNAWANGETYCYAVEDEEGNVVDSCGGYVGPDLDYMWDSIRSAVGTNKLDFADGDHGSADDVRFEYEKAKERAA